MVFLDASINPNPSMIPIDILSELVLFLFAICCLIPWLNLQLSAFKKHQNKVDMHDVFSLAFEFCVYV